MEHQQHDESERFFTHTSNLWQPASVFLSFWLTIAYQCGCGISRIKVGETIKLLLTGSIPNCKITLLIANLTLLHTKVGTNSLKEKPTKQGKVSNASVSARLQLWCLHKFELPSLSTMFERLTILVLPNSSYTYRLNTEVLPKRAKENTNEMRCEWNHQATVSPNSRVTKLINIHVSFAMHGIAFHLFLAGVEFVTDRHSCYQVESISNLHRKREEVETSIDQ